VSDDDTVSRKDGKPLKKFQASKSASKRPRHLSSSDDDEIAKPVVCRGRPKSKVLKIQRKSKHHSAKTKSKRELDSEESFSSYNSSTTPVSVEITPQPSILAYFRPEKKNAKNIVEKKMSFNSCILFKFKNFV